MYRLLIILIIMIPNVVFGDVMQSTIGVTTENEPQAFMYYMHEYDNKPFYHMQRNRHVFIGVNWSDMNKWGDLLLLGHSTLIDYGDFHGMIKAGFAYKKDYLDILFSADTIFDGNYTISITTFVYDIYRTSITVGYTF